VQRSMSVNAVITIAIGTALAAGTAEAQQVARDRTVATVRQRQTQPPRTVVRGQDRFRAEETHRETRSLAIGANGWLELRNLVGDITVTAGPGREANLEIIRRSRGMTDADVKTGLERVTVDVQTTGDRATVTARYPEERNRESQSRYGVSVSYNVTAPPGTRVAIGTTSGDVTVRNIKGDVSAQVTSGDIVVSGASQVSNLRTISGDISVSETTTDAALTVGAISGDVLFTQVKARRLAADVTSGDVIVRDSALESATLKSLSGDVEYSGPLTRGGRYELQTHSGTVVLNVSGNVGYELQASTFNGSITTPPGAAVKNVSTSRRSFRGTIGDGGAVVALTTFSGEIRVR
jgi:hypothetical protein